jgi:glucose-6-phosphate 1-dehydrogenase
MRLDKLSLQFAMHDTGLVSDVLEAYERLILDAMLGDATLFTRADEVDEQWGLVDAIAAAWKRDRPSFPNYPAGTWGPAAADDLVHRDGRSWRRH